MSAPLQTAPAPAAHPVAGPGGVLLHLAAGAASPALNLALDEALWRAASGSLLLRTYTWSVPCVTVGCLQRLRSLPPLPPDTPVLRRLTGGGAVLHDGDVTLALIGPEDRLPGTRGLHALFRAAVGRALAAVGIEVDPLPAPPYPGRRPPAACFALGTDLDVTVGGRKLAGAGLRRSRGQVLLQGTVAGRPTLLAPGATGLAELRRSPAGPQSPDTPAAPPEEDPFPAELARAFASALGARAAPGAPPTEVRAAAARLAQERYGDVRWTRRR